MSLRHRRRRSLFFGGSDAYAIGEDNPALVFDFASEFYRNRSAPSTFNDSLTYTGASAKTMVDSDGLLKWAPHNSLVGNSEDLSAWSLLGATVAANSAVAPNGTTTASLVTQNGASSAHFIYEGGYGSYIGEPRIFVVFAKPNGSDWIQVFSGGQLGTNNWANFNITTGSTGNYGSETSALSITNVGNGWYRCACTFQNSGGSGAWYFELGLLAADTNGRAPIFVGDSVSGAYFWGAHDYRSDLGGMVNNPDRGNSYVPTTSAAVGLPRRGHHIYNGSTWVNEGIQIESEARTNLVPYSEDFSNASWTKDGATIDSDAATGPDGLTSADRLNVIAGAGDHQVFASPSGYTTGDTVCNSVFAKVDGGRYLAVTLYWSTHKYVSQVFDLSDGAKGDTNLGATSGTLVSSGAENYGNGWWRLHVAGTSSAGTGNVYIAIDASDRLTPAIESGSGAPTFTAVAGEDYFIYGAQIEAGSTPSSYIPTAGSTVTRAAETLTVAAANLPYSAVNMSMQMDGEMTYADEGVNSQETMVRWYLNGNDYIIIDVDTFSAATGEVNFRQKATALDLVIASSTYLSPGVNVSYNLASRHGATFLNGALDGTALTANETPTSLVDLSATDMAIGYTYMGTIGKFRMWDEDLGDTGIAEAST